MQDSTRRHPSATAKQHNLRSYYGFVLLKNPTNHIEMRGQELNPGDTGDL